MLPIKVAVVGSCVTRDVFNSRFVKNYKKYYNCILTQNQSSMISLMSDPVLFDSSKIDNQKDTYSLKNTRQDLTKEILPLLKEKQPSFIILDFFGDVHFSVLKLNDKQYITNNRWKIMKTTFYKEIQEKNVLDNQSDEYFMLWKKYIDIFFNFVKKELPETVVILHKTRNTDFYISTDLNIKKLSTSGKVKVENINQLNDLWGKFDNYVAETYKPEVIDMTQKYYLSYEKHPWGAFYVHFTLDYYTDFIKKLHRIALNKFPEIYPLLLSDFFKDE
ncbi:hypothetical protein EWI07_03900 [Sporolactobacillus sp. THM7-4]|nr:hypothetical protein EWI07_03900 [Sporolactobacillus sp. THM7-4]